MNSCVITLETVTVYPLYPSACISHPSSAPLDWEQMHSSVGFALLVQVVKAGDEQYNEAGRNWS